MQRAATRETRSRLLARLPDEPRWVEARGALLSGEGSIFGSERGCLVRSAEQRLLSVVGAATDRELRAATAGLAGDWTLICPPEDGPGWQRQLPGWTLEIANLHTLPAAVDRVEVPPVAARIDEVTAPAPDLIAHLPEPLRHEIEVVAGKRPLFAAWVDRRAVSFCYAAFATESLWDVSVDTLAEFRGQGLATACCARAIDSLGRGGRRPVWGAVESNLASLALAEHLGFRIVDRLAVLEGFLTRN